MLTINQQKIIAETQTYKLDHVLIQNSDGLKAEVQFGVFNENNERIDTKVLSYVGEDYNNFWIEFNSGAFLYEELKAKEGLDVEVPTEVEEEFLNETTIDQIVE